MGLIVSHAFTVVSATSVAIKYPGKKSSEYILTQDVDGLMKTEGRIPLKIHRNIKDNGSDKTLTFTITADETCWFNLSETIRTGMNTDNCEFYMPGFWYHKNLRSPQEAPSFHTSKSWSVREDRLSSPLAGIYDSINKKGISILRLDHKNSGEDCLTQNLTGEVLLTGKTSIGSTGFDNENGDASLTVSFPYRETPKRYIRKLQLINPVIAFIRINKGDTITLNWELRYSYNTDYSDFVADTWSYTYDTFQPAPLKDAMSNTDAKKYLSHFFTNSYVDDYNLKYFSGVEMRTDDCINTPVYQIGFVGRVLINALNALEYGEASGNTDLVNKANAIFESTLSYGFTPDGYLREDLRLDNNKESDVMSIRRQSEGAYAVLSWLNYEKNKGRKHQDWEKKIELLMNNILSLQNADGSFPRKFKADKTLVDPTGGSTPSATLPLAMAYKYYNYKKYLDSARATGKYLENELIDKADYFSSTLDANCEDKEASLYASTAMYYLANVTKGKEKTHYLNLCKKAAYFCLSWYYMWDVPFAPGQMLGDVGFKSRGWGNVSVENNHIDVFIFDFATVLKKLSMHFSEPRFSDFAQVIETSMLQLMPTDDNMYDIAKAGYYPEVVQHTTWDYGKNGKGFYNDIFAPGWTVASLWQMLSPERLDNWN